MSMDLQKELDLRKDKVLNLKKTIGLDGQKAQVVFVLDFSGSMDSLYRDGSVQKLAERILPLGLAFDDNGEVDFYLFESGVKKLPENITMANVAGYINNKIIGKYSMGGTNYAPAVEAVVKDFAPTGGGSGFLGIGKKTPQMDLPVYVVFITDGENSDKDKTEKAIKEASNYGIFFQFIGIGHSSFGFLQKLDDLTGRNIDNANFCKVDNLGRKTDDELYALLLKEFPSFVKEARSKGMIK